MSRRLIRPSERRSKNERKPIPCASSIQAVGYTPDPNRTVPFQTRFYLGAFIFREGKYPHGLNAHCIGDKKEPFQKLMLLKRL